MGTNNRKASKVLMLVGATILVAALGADYISATGNAGLGRSQLALAALGLTLLAIGLLRFRRSRRHPDGSGPKSSDAAPSGAEARPLVRVLAFSILALFSLLCLEIGARAFAAVQVGPQAMLHGTAAADRYRRQVAGNEGNTTGRVTHDRVGYVTYEPHQAGVRSHSATDNRDVFQIRINNLGFRGEDVTFEKPKSTVRIVTLGASSTFGLRNRDAETYPVYLEQMLAERLGGDREVEVLNLGIPHLISAEIANLLEDIGQRLEPDVVTFYEGVNDTKRVENTLDRIARVSMLGVMFQRFIYDNIRAYSSDQWETLTDGLRDNFVDSLDRMRRACEELGIPFVVISQQSRSVHYADPDELRGLTYESEYERVASLFWDESEQISFRGLYFLVHHDLMEAEREWAAEHDVVFVDGIGALDRRRDTLASWVHLTAEGNRMLAEALVEPITIQIERGDLAETRHTAR